MLLLGGLLSVIIPDRFYSEKEKRLLQQFPAFSFKDVRSREYAEALEKYLADQFPARDGLVAVKTLAEIAAGKRESGGVYFAKDGYLIDVFTDYPQQQTKNNLSTLLKLQEKLKGIGIGFKVMLVPTASQILKNKLPAFAPSADQTKVLKAAKEMGLQVLDITDVLASHSDEYIFYKTDHHWTSLGAFYAYASWMQSMGRVPASLSDYKKEELSRNFRGTTYAKTNLPYAAFDVIDAYTRADCHHVSYNSDDYMTESIYERKYLKGADQYAVFLNSNQARTVVKGEGTGKCLIIKDSYANCFAQFAVDDLEETHLLDMRFFKGSVTEYIKDKGITEVLVLYNIPNFTSETSVGRIR